MKVIKMAYKEMISIQFDENGDTYYPRDITKVSFTDAQKLTDAQKTQARENISIAQDNAIVTSNNELTELWAELAELRSIVKGWPVLKQKNQWKGSIQAASITAINFVASYTTTGSEEEAWNADLNDEGKIKGYRTGTVVTISAEGNGKIRLSATNSFNMFANMTSLQSISGLELIDASQVENFAGSFYNCKALKEVDLSSWHLQKLTNASGVFNNCSSLEYVKFSRYGLPLVTATASMFEGCPNLVSVDLGRGLPVLSDKTFFKCINLEEITGLSSIKTIGEKALTYTSKLDSTDLVAKNITSIGASALRLSSIEDDVDLSTVSLDIVGDIATRNKRWSSDSLTALKNIAIPDVYIDVPNTENQDNFTDIKFGTYNGEDVSVAEGGCSAVALYHEWNAIYAGTENEYASFRDWWNAKIAPTDFVANNTMDGNTMSKLIAKLGWTSIGLSLVNDGVSQLNTIVNRLSNNLPTYISMNSINMEDETHAAVVVGGDSKARKLAILDSHVLGTTGTVSWVAFEDIFVEGTSERDSVRPFDYGTI
jgi:hypothetical protein